MRLADARGKLRQQHRSRFQDWALEYMVYLERRTLKDENDRVLETQCLNLSPGRWDELYAQPPEMPQFPGGEPEAPVTDRDELNDWYESVHAPRTVNGGSAPSDPFLAGAM